MTSTSQSAAATLSAPPAPNAPGRVAHLWVLGLSGPVLALLWHVAELARFSAPLLVAAVLGLAASRALATRDAAVGRRLAADGAGAFAAIAFELGFVVGALLLALPGLLDHPALFAVVMMVGGTSYIVLPLLAQLRYRARPHAREARWVAPLAYWTSLLAEEAILYGTFDFLRDTDALLLSGVGAGMQIFVLVAFPLGATLVLGLFFYPIVRFRTLATGEGSALEDLWLVMVALTTSVWVGPGAVLLQQALGL